MDNKAITLLRSTKGAALSLLMAFIIEGDVMGHDYLMRVTGWSKDKVTEGLRTLRDLGIIDQLPETRYNGWVLVDRDGLLDVLTSPKIQDSISSTTELSINKIVNICSSSREREAEKIGLANLSAEKMEVVKVLNSAGIMGITSLRLASTPHVTKEYAQAHIAKARKEHTKTAILITRLRDNDPIPCQDSDVRMLDSQGIYAEWINT